MQSNPFENKKRHANPQNRSVKKSIDLLIVKSKIKVVEKELENKHTELKLLDTEIATAFLAKGQELKQEMAKNSKAIANAQSVLDGKPKQSLPQRVLHKQLNQLLEDYNIILRASIEHSLEGEKYRERKEELLFEIAQLKKDLKKMNYQAVPSFYSR